MMGCLVVDMKRRRWWEWGFWNERLLTMVEGESVRQGLEQGAIRIREREVGGFATERIQHGLAFKDKMVVQLVPKAQISIQLGRRRLSRCDGFSLTDPVATKTSKSIHNFPSKVDSGAMLSVIDALINAGWLLQGFRPTWRRRSLYFLSLQSIPGDQDMSRSHRAG